MPTYMYFSHCNSTGMHRLLLIICLGFGVTLVNAQTDTLTTHINGVVLHSETRLPMPNVHVINATQVKGTVSDAGGRFEVSAKVNDSILFSYLGFQTIKVKVTNDWIKTKFTKIILTEKAYALEELTVNRYNLTGYLEVDTKLIPVSENYKYSISGLSETYEVGEHSPGAMNRVLNALFNPVDFLHNFFGKKSIEMRKLRDLKKDDAVRELLASKFDRETLATLLGVDKKEIPEILTRCNYSESFIQSANDLQIMDAINACYEEYRVLKKN